MNFSIFMDSLGKQVTVYDFSGDYAGNFPSLCVKSSHGVMIKQGLYKAWKWLSAPQP